MVVGAFTSTISSVKAKDPNFTANVIAELHYNEISSEICHQDSSAQIVVKAFDYLIQPAQNEAGIYDYFPQTMNNATRIAQIA